MIQTDLPIAIDERHFEDYPAGAVLCYGTVTVDESTIVDFGRQFDPQPFHVDPHGAASRPFGGVIASGWHTGSLMLRLLVEHFLPSRSQSKPDCGLVHTFNEVINQRDEAVMSLKAMTLMRCRGAAGVGA